MNEKAEKIYGEAFFELIKEECPDKLTDILTELTELCSVFSENGELAKIMGAPTVSAEEKISLIKEIITAGNVSEYVGNLLCVIAEKNRFSCFGGIVKQFGERYNLHFNLAEITVTTSSPLTDTMREKITAKMSAVTGKTVTIKEKVDPGIIGGIVIDSGTTRYDGSVKARLNALKNELGSIIA